MDVHARSASTGWMISPPQASSSVSRSGCPPIGEVFALVRASYARPARTPSPGTGAARKAAHPARSSPTAIGSRLPDITFRCLNSSTRLQADIAAPLRPGPAAEQAEGHGRKKRCHEGSGASSRMVRRSGIRLRSAAAAPSGLTASCAARDACKKGPGPADQGITFGQRAILEEEHRFLPSAGDRAECG